MNWSTLKYTGVHWSTLEYTGVHWSTLDAKRPHPWSNVKLISNRGRQNGLDVDGSWGRGRCLIFLWKTMKVTDREGKVSPVVNSAPEIDGPMERQDAPNKSKRTSSAGRAGTTLKPRLPWLPRHHALHSLRGSVLLGPLCSVLLRRLHRKPLLRPVFLLHRLHLKSILPLLCHALLLRRLRRLLLKSLLCPSLKIHLLRGLHNKPLRLLCLLERLPCKSERLLCCPPRLRLVLLYLSSLLRRRRRKPLRARDQRFGLHVADLIDLTHGPSARYVPKCRVC